LSCEEVDFEVRAKVEFGDPGIEKELRTVRFVNAGVKVRLE
jgi:hypothetical protein